MNKSIKIILLGLFIPLAVTAEKMYNIIDFGAKHSHIELSTSAIQSAIDAAHADGGGAVIVPEGVYVTGTLFLKSNVTIKMEANTELFGSSSLADYADIPLGMEEPHFSKSLFYAHEQENIKIIGDPRSEINGKGYMFKHSPERPKLFRIENCNNVEFDNAIIKNSGSWCVYFKECDSVYIHHTSVYNKENRNNDGMNFDGCSNVRIDDCNLQVEDDAICLKSSVDKLCENFLVTNCTISSYWACVKFGTASKSGFRNVKINNCQFFDSRHGCIKLLAVDGATLEDVEFSDIKMFNCAGPIFIRLGNRGRDYSESIRQVYKTDAEPEGRPVGQIKNITFRNIEGRLTGRLSPPTEGIMITGLPNHYVENITFENIHFSYSGFGNLNVADRVINEDEARYPEQLFFGILPSYGMYARHVKGLHMKNVTMKLRQHDDRPAIVMDDVLQSTLETISLDAKPEAKVALVMKNTMFVNLDDIQVDGEIDCLIKVKGEQSKGLELRNVKVKNKRSLVKFDDGAKSTSLEQK